MPFLLFSETLEENRLPSGLHLSGVNMEEHFLSNEKCCLAEFHIHQSSFSFKVQRVIVFAYCVKQ